MVYQQQPGDALLKGQIDGRRLGTALFELGPTLPHESPVPMPRFLAACFLRDSSSSRQYCQRLPRKSSKLLRYHLQEGQQLKLLSRLLIRL